jgi:hypothetical protein
MCLRVAWLSVDREGWVDSFKNPLEGFHRPIRIKDTKRKEKTCRVDRGFLKLLEGF